MSIGKTILDLPLAVTLEDTMKIPTGGFGDQTVELADLRDYLVGGKHVYLTNDPALLASNGTYQKLTLLSSGTLSCVMDSGSFVFVKVVGGFNLDVSAFRLVKPFEYDPRFECVLVLFDFLGEHFAMGLSYVPSGKSNPDPESWDTVVYFPMTSNTYPQLVEDSMLMSGLVTGGELRQTLKTTIIPLEALGYSLVATDGELRQILKSTAIPLEALGYSLVADDGELRQILKSTTIPLEALGYSLVADDGELRQILISQNYGTEGLTYSLVATDGELNVG